MPWQYLPDCLAKCGLIPTNFASTLGITFENVTIGRGGRSVQIGPKGKGVMISTASKGKFAVTTLTEESKEGRADEPIKRITFTPAILGRSMELAFVIE